MNTARLSPLPTVHELARQMARDDGRRIHPRTLTRQLDRLAGPEGAPWLVRHGRWRRVNVDLLKAAQPGFFPPENLAEQVSHLRDGLLHVADQVGGVRTAQQADRERIRALEDRIRQLEKGTTP